MIKLYKTIAILFALTTLSFAQNSNLDYACLKIKEAVYKLDFNYDTIVSRLDYFNTTLQQSTIKEYNNCNCADTLWVLRHTHRYKYLLLNTHSTDLDTIQFLNNIAVEIDKMNLNFELHAENILTQNDSFKFVINRLDVKHNKTKYIFNLINTEIDYLKRNKYKLFDKYLKVLDDSIYNFEIKDDILLSLFNSNETVAEEIRQRIILKRFEPHFYRMLGVIYSSSEKRPIQNQLTILNSINYDIEKEKIDFLLRSIINQIDEGKIKWRDKRRIKKALNNEILKECNSINILLSKI